MTRKGLLVVAMSALVAAHWMPVSADTHAPSQQSSTLTCNGQLLSFVSPGFHALAGQETNSTRVGVVLRITFDGQVIYENQALGQFPSGLLATCTDGLLALTFVKPPLM